MSKPPRGVI